MSTTRRRLRNEPGLISFVVVILYSVFVWTWWPADVLIGRISLVIPLMSLGVALWVVLSFVFVFWVERLESQESVR
ncbi:hypothetical protein [Ornithinimicrobium sp. W1665]|uniref:hypothetical protein n=1 Tax=Ornithinimicrobium sp. W1665 TaxID=3416666 RepID=UPI003CF0052C